MGHVFPTMGHVCSTMFLAFCYPIRHHQDPIHHHPSAINQRAVVRDVRVRILGGGGGVEGTNQLQLSGALHCLQNHPARKMFAAAGPSQYTVTVTKKRQRDSKEEGGCHSNTGDSKEERAVPQPWRQPGLAKASAIGGSPRRTCLRGPPLPPAAACHRQ